MINACLSSRSRSGAHTQAAEQLHSTMIRKFRLNPDVWVNFGLFHFKSGQAESARALMQRSLKSLEKKQRTC